MAQFTEVDAHTRAGWIDFRGKDLQQFLMLLYVLLALSIIVSLFGMVNALVLTVFERTREIGMMRAVGMSRHQVRRMVRQESVITALIGAGLGLPVGLLVAAAMAGALGLRLAGPRVYGGVLVEDAWMGAGRAEATVADLRRGLRVYRAACGLQLLLLVLAAGALRAIGL